MLPMLVNGLKARDALLPGVEDWMAEHFAGHVAAAGDRIKAQTIRAFGGDNPRSPYGRVQPGDRLDTPAAVRWLSCEPLLGPVDLTRVGYGEDPFDECGGHPESAIGAVATGMWWDATTGHFWSDNRHVDGSRSGLELSARYPRIDWVVCGGESGARSRPMHPDWARGLRDQCAATSLPFLFKQWGEWAVTYDRDAEDPDWRRCPTARDNNERYLNLAGGHGFHGERVVFVRKSGKKAAGRLLDGVLHDGYPEV